MTTPKQIGQYVVLKHLATGGMGEVFLTYQRGMAGFRRLAVVKRVRPDVKHRGDFVRRFLEEARLVALLNHPNIVQVYELGHTGEGKDEDYFIALEYVHGRDLAAIIRALRERGERLPLDLALKIAADLCAALHYAHHLSDLRGADLHIVHRDISPQNVLISSDGLVKLTDFGIAKHAQSEGKTVVGVLRGKFAYMAPEQILQTRLDSKCDLYALGVVLYEMTVGRRPIEGKNDEELAKTILQARFQTPVEVDPQYPPRLSEIVCRAMRRVPKERYADANELGAELSRFAAEARLHASNQDLSALMERLFPGEPRPSLDDFDTRTASGESTGLQPVDFTQGARPSTIEPTKTTTSARLGLIDFASVARRYPLPSLAAAGVALGAIIGIAAWLQRPRMLPEPTPLKALPTEVAEIQKPPVKLEAPVHDPAQDPMPATTTKVTQPPVGSLSAGTETPGPQASPAEVHGEAASPAASVRPPLTPPPAAAVPDPALTPFAAPGAPPSAPPSPKKRLAKAPKHETPAAAPTPAPPAPTPDEEVEIDETKLGHLRSAVHEMGDYKPPLRAAALFQLQQRVRRWEMELGKGSRAARQILAEPRAQCMQDDPCEDLLGRLNRDPSLARSVLNWLRMQQELDDGSLSDVQKSRRQEELLEVEHDLRRAGYLRRD